MLFFFKYPIVLNKTNNNNSPNDFTIADNIPFYDKFNPNRINLILAI